jgi:hypothetical protein
MSLVVGLNHGSRTLSSIWWPILQVKEMTGKRLRG